VRRSESSPLRGQQGTRTPRHGGGARAAARAITNLGLVMRFDAAEAPGARARSGVFRGGDA